MRYPPYRSHTAFASSTARSSLPCETEHWKLCLQAGDYSDTLFTPRARELREANKHTHRQKLYVVVQLLFRPVFTGRLLQVLKVADSAQKISPPHPTASFLRLYL